MTIGPVQLLVIGFAEGEFHGQIRAELDRLRANDTIRLLDVAFVSKDSEGNISRVELSDLSPVEGEEVGALAGALIGLGAAGTDGAQVGAEFGAAAAASGHLLPDDVWYVEDALQNAEAAAVALIEHRWAIGLRDAIREAGGFHLADAWVHPLDLVAIGLLHAEDADQQIMDQAS
jgi:uncharacterized membrane protein